MKATFEELESRKVLSIVAVIDSGIDFNHPDLRDKIWNNPLEIRNGSDDDGNGYVDDINGWDFVENDNTPQDGFYHGTFVAGIIASVSPQSFILPVRFQGNNGIGYSGAAVSSILYVTQLKKSGAPIAAMNVSWGGVSYLPGSIETALKGAIDAGISVVIAAGNEGIDTDVSPRYPSSFELNTITVAATDESNNLASFSNYGAKSIDIGARGVNVRSTSLGGGYSILSGTSFAAPQITGAIGLIAQSKNLNVQTIKSIILDTSKKVDVLQNKVLSAGVLDSFSALNQSKLISDSTPAIVIEQPVNNVWIEEPKVSTKWTTVSGSFKITSNTLTSQSNGISIVLSKDFLSHSVNVSSDFSLGSSRSFGLILGHSGDTYYHASISKMTGGYVAQIYLKNGKISQLLASKTTKITRGKIEFVASGSRLKLCINNRVVLVSNRPIKSVGSVGYRTSGYGATGSNFSIKAI